ncbi:MAG: xanthine dehydrogenase family protein molybdopterin-binding subunit [Pigmentiphaga sp.]|uniref:xanthine dehydrogenase family protein molybdopterin-binding subunit n=1 Tax=Pigmentiphaga sp. TaxID=1977564 RepID=UPI0029A930F1|nr:xanthine dehydrogenase family protein molybdopterin-binding subunit [Pigmentiphaga sp.]MDX3904701.1 xanthine dehydrogenase family protein molybdopterin-binding subunit [Pigmentiphaga sp.]
MHDASHTVAQGMGGAVPPPRNRRLLAGRGRYVADLPFLACLHAAFVRCPVGHARIVRIDTEAARAMPGVEAVFTGADIAAVCRGYRGATAAFPALRAPVQYPLAIEKAMWNGEPVAMIVADSRARAEDACARVIVEWEELPALTDPRAALTAPAIHAGLPDNLVLHLDQRSGEVESAFAGAAHVVECEFGFNRHTGVPMETRGVVAEFEPSERRLTVHLSHQCPHQMQQEFAQLLGLDAHRIRVVCPDVGGAFGVKQQLYGDELAVCAASVLLGRPVRFIADRAESMLSDIQAREHQVKGRLAVDGEGCLLAFDVQDLYAIGPYSQYPRSSLGEPRAIMGLCGAPYRFDAFAASSDIVFQNKVMAGHYRGVGHPLACAVTEALVDEAARACGIGPVEIRRRNFLRPGDFPYVAPTGTRFERLAFSQSLEALERAVDLPALHAEIAQAREEGRIQGLGIAAFVEQTSRGPWFYGQGEQAVSSRDGCTLRLEPSGAFRCISSVTEQGQGTEMGVRQVVADALGVELDRVEVMTGDTAATAHGGGTWGSRGMAIGGQAAWEAAAILRREILQLAAIALHTDADALSIRGGDIVGREDGAPRLALRALAEAAHYRPYEFGGVQPQLVASATYGPLTQPYRCGTGIQLSRIEVDADTGQIRLLRHVVVHEAGRIVNPLLVDGQIRGGVAQGLGAALMEECAYDERGRALASSLSSYPMPMAIDLPDIELVHAESPPLTDDGLGIVGVGEAGTVGAAAALMNALNDALAAAGRGRVYCLPLTPERVLRALGVLG